ncbi:hypothetical protein Tco_0548734 [Tanacetum coccineum]
MPSVILVQTVASISIGGVSQKSLVNHCLDGFWMDNNSAASGHLSLSMSSKKIRESLLPSVPDVQRQSLEVLANISLFASESESQVPDESLRLCGFWNFKLLDENQVVLRAPRQNGKSGRETQEHYGCTGRRISAEDVVQAAQDKPSKNTPKDIDVEDSEDIAEKEEQHMIDRS